MKKFNWKKYIELRPDLKRNWNGPLRARIHYYFFREKEVQYFLKPTAKLLKIRKQKNKNQKKEVAIIFFGITRSLRYTLPFIEKNVLHVLDTADIPWHLYVHTYDQQIIYNERSGELGTETNYREDIALLPSNTYTLGTSSREDTLKNISIQDYITHGDPYQGHGKETPLRSLQNLLLQLHSLKKAFHLVPEEKSDTAYLFIRPDLAYVDPFPTNLVQKCLKKSKEKLIFTPEWQQWGGLNDRFAITNTSGAQAYAERIDQAQSYAQKKQLHAEKFLSHCISTHNQRGLTSRALRVRAHGMISPIDLEELSLTKKDLDAINNISKIHKQYFKQIPFSRS